MDLRFAAASDRSLLVYTADVPGLLRALEVAALPAVINLHPAYESLLIVFEPLACDHAELESQVRDISHAPPPVAARRMVEIPVRYDGTDLRDVAALHGITTDRVIELHSSSEYAVAFLGFMPGFAYLTGLPDELATPRLDTPRRRVEAGSVGIAGRQTGVYPFSSPGGWRLIGQTTLEMFRVDRTEPSLLRTGDRVRFKPV
jgi:KipI family sensor histidine kinase inhibitor